MSILSRIKSKSIKLFGFSSRLVSASSRFEDLYNDQIPHTFTPTLAVQRFLCEWRNRRHFEKQRRKLLYLEPDSVLADLGLTRVEVYKMRYKTAPKNMWWQLAAANDAHRIAPRDGRRHLDLVVCG